MIVTFEIDDQIVTEAIGGATIGYWADQRDSETAWSRHRMELVVVERDPRKVIALTPADFARGAAILAQNAPSTFARLASGNADAYTGDALIQCAAFGEIKYG